MRRPRLRRRRATAPAPREHQCPYRRQLDNLIEDLARRRDGGGQAVSISYVLELATGLPAGGDPRADPLTGCLPVTPH